MLRQNLLILILISSLFACTAVQAQKQGVHWLTFAQLEDSLAVKPKKVFIDFYADWCAYCKKMDEAAFRDREVVTSLNNYYYAVRMNAESRDTIIFGGVHYVNREYGKKRNPVHEIPKLLASREGIPFTLPALVVLDASFRVQNRYFEYLSPEEMRKILH
ncbi:thioredoxin family protein [Robiginitalea aurantiaca]|uniref:Thioredoxin family protein n=1 Tax=Robiginitalea aurantiaca TaxID=3056915 RepID=A0ABT7WAX7_9FLAO|nr:thioredoxin family protein [Robiginitalea aurantiaca]MDM9630071.1 thioredoxin family protein [Robiginitalea aurantiaca]